MKDVDEHAILSANMNTLVEDAPFENKAPPLDTFDLEMNMDALVVSSDDTYKASSKMFLSS